MGTLYNLSDCYEQIGRTASAWSGFRDVAAQAKAAALEAAGVKVGRTPSETASLVREIMESKG